MWLQNSQKQYRSYQVVAELQENDFYNLVAFT